MSKDTDTAVSAAKGALEKLKNYGLFITHKRGRYYTVNNVGKLIYVVSDNSETNASYIVKKWEKDLQYSENPHNVYFYNTDEEEKDSSPQKRKYDEDKTKHPWGCIKATNDTISLLKRYETRNIPFNKFESYNYEEIANLIKEELHIGMLKEQLNKLINNAGAKQIICHGAPGTGKTYTVTNLVPELNSESKGSKEFVWEEEDFVQFHPSYDYTDFIEGLRPVLINGKTHFVRMDGIFKKFCRKVAEKNKKNEENTDNKEKYYLFIIDEINRADLSKVFGELMYCLEEGYRGEEKGIPTQYSNLPTYEVHEDGEAGKMDGDVFEKKFYIPENVIIIGTMNDIDRSVESFDFAMQRRFSWINVHADSEMTEKVLKEMWEADFKRDGTKKLEATDADKLAKYIVEHAKFLNSKIADKANNLGEEYKIGHTYYKKAARFYNEAPTKDEKKKLDYALEKVYQYSIKPVLDSYLRGKRNKPDLSKKFEKAFLNLDDTNTLAKN